MSCFGNFSSIWEKISFHVKKTSALEEFQKHTENEVNHFFTRNIYPVLNMNKSSCQGTGTQSF
jgi:hypothetical protein